MQQPASSWNDSYSLPQRIERIKSFCFYPALVVMVPLRRNMGFRLIGPGACVMGFVMFALGHVAQDGVSGPLLQIYAICFFFGAALQWFKQWRRWSRGAKVHTYYIGDSVLARLWWPRFMREQRRIQRFVEPAAVVIGAMLLLPMAPVCGAWFICCGLALRVYESWIYHQALAREMDMTDSIIEAEAQSEVVNYFSFQIDQAKTRTSHTESGIPTGNAADIQDAIRRRKGGRNKPR